MEKTNNILDAIKYCRFQKNRTWRNFLTHKSMLENCLESLSKKEENELTKTDLLGLIALNCDYMRSLNLYNYFKYELSCLLVKKEKDTSDIVNNE